MTTGWDLQVCNSLYNRLRLVFPSQLLPSTFRSFDMVRPFDKLRDRRLTNRAQDTAGSRHRKLRDHRERIRARPEPDPGERGEVNPRPARCFAVRRRISARFLLVQNCPRFERGNDGETARRPRKSRTDALPRRFFARHPGALGTNGSRRMPPHARDRLTSCFFQPGTCAVRSALKSLPWLGTRKCSSSCAMTKSWKPGR